MSRTFAYVRVSTVGQTTENQIHEIEGAGFKVDRRRVVSETVSGSSAIAQRPGFQQLLNRVNAIRFYGVFIKDNFLFMQLVFIC